MQKSERPKPNPTAPAAVITRVQFQAIAPDAAPETVDALFAFGIGGQSPINRILNQYEITEPHVVAQFLTALSLASKRFTDLSRPLPGLSAIDWFTARAREWHDAGANEDASVWLWMEIVDGYAGTTYAIPTIYWNDVHDRLAAVCAVLGVVDRSEEFAIEDSGYDMQ